MLVRDQLFPGDLAWRPGMAEWRPLGELVQLDRQAAPQFPMSVSPVAADNDDYTVAGLVGQMGCGCLVWIGLLVLAIGGGVIFPVLLILLPIAVIGGLIDMVRKIIRLAKRSR